MFSFCVRFYLFCLGGGAGEREGKRENKSLKGLFWKALKAFEGAWDSGNVS